MPVWNVCGAGEGPAAGGGFHPDSAGQSELALRARVGGARLTSAVTAATSLPQVRCCGVASGCLRVLCNSEAPLRSEGTSPYIGWVYAACWRIRRRFPLNTQLIPAVDRPLLVRNSCACSPPTLAQYAPHQAPSYALARGRGGDSAREALVDLSPKRRDPHHSGVRRAAPWS